MSDRFVLAGKVLAGVGVAILLVIAVVQELRDGRGRR